MAATHPRFLRWVEDACVRTYDQEWLDYQHEIALRHHRSKKTRPTVRRRRSRSFRTGTCL